jgi:hypothetical protein
MPLPIKSTSPIAITLWISSRRMLNLLRDLATASAASLLHENH